MNINIDKKIINGSFSAMDNKFAKQYNKTEIVEMNSDQLAKYNTELQACSANFQQVFGAAKNFGLELEFIKETAADGTNIYRLTDESKKAIAEVNRKYMDGTISAKAYASAQRMSARAADITASSNAKLSTALGKAATAANVDTASENKNTLAKRISATITEIKTAATTKGIAKTLAAIAAEKLHATALNGSAAAMKMFAASAATLGIKSLAGLAIGLGKVLVPMLALSLAFKAVEYIWDKIPTMGNLKKHAEESAQALEDVKSELESINSELETTQSRINELESQGPLSIVEQEELERLKETNVELERQKKLKESEEKRADKEASDDAVDALWRQMGTTDSSGKYSEIVVLTNKYNIAKQNYEDALKDGSEADIEKYQKALDKAETKLRETITEASGYIDDVNLDLVSEEDKEFVQNIDSYINDALFSLGDIGALDVLRFNVGEEDFERFNNGIKEFAASGKEVTKSNLAKYIGEDLTNAAITAFGGIEQLMEHIRSLQNVDVQLDNIINSDQFKDQNIQEKIDEMLGDGDFEITAQSITKLLGVDFIKACNEAGYSTTFLVDHWKNAKNELAEKGSISGAIDDLATFEENLTTLGTALSEFESDGNVSSKTLKSISGMFDDAAMGSEKFQNAINTLGDSTSSVEEARDAIEDLADMYMNSADVTANLTDETKDLYIAKLKAMGVANAAEVVERRLAIATLQSADADKKAKKAAMELLGVTDDVAAALWSKAYQALNVAQQEDVMRAVEEMVAGSNFAGVMYKHSDALYALAAAAGYTKTEIAQVAAAYATLAKLGNSKNLTAGQLSSVMAASRQVVNFEAQMKEAMESISKLFSNNYNLSNTGNLPGYSPSENGKSGNDSKKEEKQSDKNKNAYDKAKKKLDHQLEMNKISYRKYYKELVKIGNKYLKNQKGNLEDWRGHLETLADVRRDIFEKERDELEKKFKSGKIGYETYYNQLKVLEKKWYKGRKSNAEDYEKAQIERRDRMLEAFEDAMDKVEETIEIKDFYKTWEPNENAVSAWERYIDKIDDAQRKGILRWRDWYDLRLKTDKELAEARKKEYEIQKDNIDDLIDMVSDMLKQEREDMIDALNKQKDRYNDIVDAKKKALDLTRDQLNYEKEIRDMNRDLTELQVKADLLKHDTSREGQAKYKAVLEEIRAKQEEIASKQDDRTYDATMDILDESVEKYEEKIEKKIEDIEELMNHQGEWLKYVYSYINKTDPSTLLNQLTVYNDKYGTGIANDINKMWDNYENVKNKYIGSKIEEIIDILRAEAEKVEEGLVEDTDMDGDGIPDKSENYSTIGSLIGQLKSNVAKMKEAKKNGDFETYNSLDKANQNITKRISDISNGQYDDLRQVNDYTYTTSSGVNLFDLVSDKNRTAITIINDMKKAKEAAERNELAKELRQIHGYEDLFYDKKTGYWYKNASDYINQKVLFDEDGNVREEKDFKLTGKEGIAELKDALKTNLARGSVGINAVKTIVEAIKKFDGYKNTWYDPSTKHVYKSALGFYNLLTLDAGKIGTADHASGTRIINAMKASGNADVNNALADILRKKFKLYESLTYNKDKKKWVYTKDGKKINLYHTGLGAGFVSDGNYLPTPKQNELYALLQKGELVLNRSDQDKLMLQMQVLSGMQDSIKKMVSSASTSSVPQSQPIIINLEQPIIINGNADKSTVNALAREGQKITNQTLNTLQDALKMRGFNGRVQTNRK
ncbi:hypothetical protein AALA22_08800 [Anaerovoracaceae bacterium 41-7]